MTHESSTLKDSLNLTKVGRQPSQEELLELMHRFDQYPASQA